ncbi:uncharacterized protein LOC103722536 [Phoenix dactylifera]|uniref:Uncharacterized protein LOC103722536 n=1 Tax=Phoenix dactylifera TaxID=42345 RepID=A0A8B9ARJ4_PHODC|nr:uncharacterized protein LOC103722536 [Phoenix dactylifera]
MRKLSANLDREDGLDTVLEVPIPEEMFSSGGNSRSHKSLYTNMKAWMRSHVDRPAPSSLGREAELLQLMLGVIGAPLVPLPVQAQKSIISHHIKAEDPIEASMAKYIIQQYIAASGGEQALNSVNSMYAIGKVRMTASEVLLTANGNDTGPTNKKVTKGGRGGEMGGFVLWQKKPDLWCLELVVAGRKISAGSDGKVAWRQTPWHQSHASRGPPRPLRRALQGLDPRSTASLFSDAVCLGEKAVNGEDCFVLRLDAQAAALRARSSGGVEIIRHSVWGYFSQRTGLLVQLEDSLLLRIKSASEESAYWETTMESFVEDYRPIDGIYIAHAGRTAASLFRFGGSDDDGHTRTRMEEAWAVEEVDFNIRGLSVDCFLPPGDLEEEKPGCDAMVNSARPPTRAQALPRIGHSKVAALDVEDSDPTHEEDGRRRS